MSGKGKKTLRYWLFYSFWIIVPVITIIVAATMYGVLILAIPFTIMFVFGNATDVLREIFWDEYEKVYGEKR